MKSQIVIDNELIQSQARIIKIQERMIEKLKLDKQSLQDELKEAYARIENMKVLAKQIKG